MSLTFTVYGVPQPQGSTRAFIKKGMRFPVVVSDNTKLKPWRQEVAGTARVEMAAQRFAYVGKGTAVRIEARFIFQKPKSARKAVQLKTTKPDLDKLIRALCDSLTGILFRDDAQVAQCSIVKVFGEPSRAEITVTAI